MLLTRIQNTIQDRYDLDIPYCIEHFVSSDRQLANQLADAQEKQGQHRPALNEEVVFIQQCEDSLEFTVYFDKTLLASVKTTDADLNEVCAVVEGASHAVCLLWHAHHERQIRPVDLELQAEIDKYMVLVGDHEGPTKRRALHRHLFANSRIVEEEGSAVHERYRVATQLASHYCHWLDKNFLSKPQNSALQCELARFYRLSGRMKFDYIQRLD